MADRIPKAPGQKRRRNHDPSAARLDGAAASRPEPLEGWHPRTVEAWDAWWESPMAAIWLDGDVPGLLMLAAMVDEVHSGSRSAALKAEIRMLANEFGLTPLSRRRLQWEVSKSQGAEPAVTGPEDDERWLRVVSG